MRSTLCIIACLTGLAACGQAPQESSVAGAAPALPSEPPAAAVPPAAPASAPRGWFRARLAAASGGDIAFVIDGQATLQRDPQQPARYRLDGRQLLSVEWIHCTPTASPAEQPLADATLEIEPGSGRYTLRAGSLWDATVAGSCPGLGSASVPMRVPGRLEVSGTVGPDGRIAGERVSGDLHWEWSFDRP